MPAYMVSSLGSPSGDLGIKAGTLELRIVSIFFTGNDTGAFISVYRYTGSTLSGGSSIPVVPSRGGGPTASATCQQGSLSYSGTSTIVTNIYAPPGRTVTSNGGFNLTQYQGSSSSIQPPASAFTIPPNQVLRIQGVTGNRVAVVNFEEINFPGSY